MLFSYIFLAATAAVASASSVYSVYGVPVCTPSTVTSTSITYVTVYPRTASEPVLASTARLVPFYPMTTGDAAAYGSGTVPPSGSGTGYYPTGTAASISAWGTGYPSSVPLPFTGAAPRMDGSLLIAGGLSALAAVAALL